MKKIVKYWQKHNDRPVNYKRSKALPVCYKNIHVNSVLANTVNSLTKGQLTALKRKNTLSISHYITQKREIIFS